MIRDSILRYLGKGYSRSSTGHQITRYPVLSRRGKSFSHEYPVSVDHPSHSLRHVRDRASLVFHPHPRIRRQRATSSTLKCIAGRFSTNLERPSTSVVSPKRGHGYYAKNELPRVLALLFFPPSAASGLGDGSEVRAR